MSDDSDHVCDVCYAEDDVEPVVEQVWRLYRKACTETVRGCSDDLEMFLADLRSVLDGRRPTPTTSTIRRSGRRE